MTMPIRQAWLESFAVDLDEVKNASRELNLKVQIVSRAPDQSLYQSQQFRQVCA